MSQNGTDKLNAEPPENVRGEYRLLLEFIDESHKANVNWHPNNWYACRMGAVTGAAKSALRYLSESQLVDYHYYQLLYSGRHLSGVKQADLHLALQAYDRFLGEVKQDFHAAAKRHELLLLTGYDDAGELPSGRVATVKEIKRRDKLISLIGRYWHLPGMRSKAKNFMAIAPSHATLAGEVLHHRRFRGAQTVPGDPYEEEYYDVTDLSFWGFLLCAMFDAPTRKQILQDMWENTFNLPQHDKHNSILIEVVKTVIATLDDEDPVLSDYQERLNKHMSALIAACEAARLAKSLDWPLPDEGWALGITIAIDGNDQWYQRPHLSLKLMPDVDRDWEIDVTRDGGAFHQGSGAVGVTQNDLDFEPLEIGHLHELPQWLHKTIEKQNLRPHFDDVQIYTGKHRKAAKPFREWLGI